MKPIQRAKHIKLILLIIIGVTLIAMVSVFAGNRYVEPTAKPLLSAIRQNATLSLCTIRQVATRDGETDWCLNARSAEYFNDKNEADFMDPSVTFYLENRNKVYLTARKGTVRTDTNDMQVQGDVVVRSSDFELKTDSLRYDNGKRVFVSDQRVVLTSPNGDITANGASYDTETGMTIFTGNIKGTFESGINL